VLIVRERRQIRGPDPLADANYAIKESLLATLTAARS
jgi:hypothetical protein